MPLHTNHETGILAFHGFNHSIRGASGDTEQTAGFTHRLMVEGIDGEAHAEEVANHSGFGGDEVGGCAFGGLLTVFDEQGAGMGCGDVLLDAPAQRSGKHLNATADAEHRDVAGVGLTDEFQFEFVANGIDVSQCGHRVFADEQGVEVGAAGENESVNVVQHVKGFAELRTMGRKQERQTAHRFDGRNIAGLQLELPVFKIGCDADDGAARRSLTRRGFFFRVHVVFLFA